MRLPKYHLHYLWKLTFITILLSFKSLIPLIAFPEPGKLMLTRVAIFFLAIVISLIIVRGWRYKLLTILFIVIFSYFQGMINLWKIPAKKYSLEFFKKYDAPINSIISNDSVKTIRLGSEGLRVYSNHYQNDTLLFSASERKLILKMVSTSDVKEVEKDKNGVLFIMSRFIDNGHGLFYSTSDNIEIIKATERYKINGLEVTGTVWLWGNWYYLSFT